MNVVLGSTKDIKMKHIRHLIIIFFTIFFSLNSLWAADECTTVTTTDMNVSESDPIEVGPADTVTIAEPDYYYIKANPEDINGTLTIYFTGTNVSQDVYMTYSDLSCPTSDCSAGTDHNDSLEIDLSTISNNDINVKIYTCANGNKNYGKLKVIYTKYGGTLPDTNTTIVFGKVDFIDQFTTSANYLNDSYIKTKISNYPTLSNISTQGYQIDSVWVDDTVDPPVPQVYAGSSSATDIPLTVLYYKANDNCTVDILNNQLFTGLNDPEGKPYPVVAEIKPGDYSGTSNRFLMPAESSKAKRLVAQYIDFYRVYLETGEGCLLNSQPSQNAVPGLSACVASSEQYESAFGPSIADKCLNNNGNPCDPNNHGYGTGRYDHKYGCYQCTLEGSAEYSCSRDNFAIRPDVFAINSTHTDFPNLLRSAKDYNLTVYAYDYGVTSGTDGSDDYNITGATAIFDLDTTKYDKNGDSSSSMHGTAVWSAYDFNMSDGVSWSNAAVGSEVAGTKFDDVGKINLQVIDKVWAAVDINNPVDPTLEDCSVNGAWICGDKNVTYIPDHFDFADLNVTNNNGNPGTFTYIANEVELMAGRIHTRMRALNADGAVTQNFATFPLWENNVTVVPVVTTSRYIYTDANETNITALTIGFGGTDGDANGTRTIAWNENNTSQYLRFNFQRDVNQTANPFDVNGGDLNITITSNYIDPDDMDTAEITGSRIGTIQPADGNVTFLYGRTHASRQRYQEDSGTANIYFESYCFGSGCTKTLLPNGINSTRTDDVRWYVNGAHTVPDDGAVGIVVQKGGANVAADIVDATDNPIGNPSITTIDYDENQGYPYKTTMQNEASLWLIYNESDSAATRNEFQVEFHNQGDWTGDNATDTTTNTPTDKASTNRRIMW